jgi:hypothetical protein
VLCFVKGRLDDCGEASFSVPTGKATRSLQDLRFAGGADFDLGLGAEPPEANAVLMLATFTDFGVSITAPPYETTAFAPSSDPGASSAQSISRFDGTRRLVFTSFNILRLGDGGEFIN